MELVALAAALVALAVSGIALAQALGASRAAADGAGGRTTGGGAGALPEDVLGLRQEVAALRAESAGALRHLSVVRYDAFGDVGGHLSWSVALLDDAGDGVLLTSIHGRSEARSYAKTISAGACAQQLSPEEQEALTAALGEG